MARQDIISNNARSRGRPAGNGATDRRDHILDHASRLFAEQGLEATSVQMIADAAGVDRRLVYHYFDSKDKLYLEVLASIYGELTGLAQALLPGTTNIEQFVDVLCRTFFQFCLDHRPFVQMLMWENLRGAKGLRTVPVAGQVIKGARPKLQVLLDEAVADGRCRGDLDPTQIIMSCLGMSLYPITNAASLNTILDIDTSTDAFRERWLEHMIQTIIHGLRPPSENTP
ncbi:TetR/AcrR family transcriptional regulator [Phycisphaerales bacterium AB-hyl4]|uniref:TetR/AcrR family transcriptional regulator n=1 Tax=Natronomicrosphaera hydrolytica TaxID=3242702 RepID=A0ABV4U3E8_9BACT